MKLFKNISIVFAFLLICAGAAAQQQCRLKLSDETPSPGQYYADLTVYFDGNFESQLTNIPVTLDEDNYIPFGILNDVEDNLYQIKIDIWEPGAGSPVPFWSSYFNSDYWRYNDIVVLAPLP
ncbi:MAG: hypothetical protein ABIK52_00275 [Bacteroidota bacterium]